MDSTRIKILEVAIGLFHANGYSGTSVRDIATKAGVNVAQISYYFSSKAGLHEYLITSFLEEYMQILETHFNKIKTYSARECLLSTISTVLKFHSDNSKLASYVYREITLQSTFTREIMATYLAKEKRFYKFVFEYGRKKKEFHAVSVPLTVSQLRSMIIMPFLQSSYLSEVWQIMPYDPHAIVQYEQNIVKWLDQMVFVQNSDKLAL
ncbi:MAG: forespore capture DNA-binding protein RefZ [Bacillaceae bacterium]|nr:forespore capture DNA-binding protein RefZ [Bacillaceae bacterium]